MSASCLTEPMAMADYSGDKEYAVSDLVKERAYSFDTAYLRNLSIHIAAPGHSGPVELYLFNQAGDVCVATIGLQAGADYLGPIISAADLQELNLIDLEVSALGFAAPQQPIALRFELRRNG